MTHPNLNEEKKLWKRGYKCVACLDEAGRGPLAGPVVAAAVVLENLKSKIQMSNKILKSKCQKRVLDFGHWDLIGHWDLGFGISKLRDSKKLSPRQREKFYKLITKNPSIGWGIGIVSEKVIDKINILEATKLAMEKAVQKLKKKPDFLILDGKMKLDLKVPQKSIVKADEKVFSVALASIIAKTTRDRLMMKYHKEYPQYRFDLHKGYPTKLHLKMLKKYGICKIHRNSFAPVAKLANKNNIC